MKNRKIQRLARRRRIRSRVSGTADRPRLAVSRSNTSMTVQLIDDTKGVTLVAAHVRGVTVAKAAVLGTDFAKQMTEKKVSTAVFDRGGFLYHGVIKAFADAVRQGGITI